ncbi:hypothetical protein F5X96DRAFT_658825 [Biscogniauxia mediterranea]|nr:hypothetical protein F5X96DRAFT_658825 [Biscogniauxia mediterranea]
MLYQLILAVIMAAGIILAAPITTPRGMSAAALPGAVVGSQPATHPGLSPLYIAIIVVCSLSAAITIVVTAIKYHDLCCWCWCWCCCCLKKQRQQQQQQVAATTPPQQGVVSDLAKAYPAVARPEACHQAPPGRGETGQA